MRLPTKFSSLLAVAISSVLASTEHDKSVMISARVGKSEADFKIQNYVFGGAKQELGQNIFVASAGLIGGNQAIPQIINWNRIDNGLVINKIELWDMEKPFAVWPSPTTQSSASPTGPRGGSKVVESRQSPDIISLNFNAGTNFLPLFIDTVANPLWDRHFNTTIFMQISWSLSDSSTGWSKSNAFAIARNASVVESAAEVVDKSVNNDGLDLPAEGNDSPTASSTSAQPTATGSSSTPAAGSNVPAPQPSGLAPGAIAGIVVGAVVGLALIGGLVWFFCFRRRKQQGQSRELGYGNDAGAAAMIADKEQPGVSESSPHSAYGDDGGRLHDRGSAVVDASYMPYSDHAPHAQNIDHAAHAAPTGHNSIPPQTTGGTMSTSQENSTRYAHLVEEGMTPEEIRRLEEEERALDQAIDAAGHNRGGAH